MLDKSLGNIQDKKFNQFESKLRREVQPVFRELPDNIKLMYTSETCAMCGAHLTIRQLNRVISGQVPPVCLKCYKEMKGQVEKLAPLFQQIGLF